MAKRGAGAWLLCMLALGGCSAMTNLLASEPPALTAASTPPGAQASIAGGGSCRTPCMLPVPDTADFAVTFTLDGYLPQTVPVRVAKAAKSALIDQTPPTVEPDPVFAQLVPAPPPSPSLRVSQRRLRPRPPSPAPAASFAPPSLAAAPAALPPQLPWPGSQ